MPQHRSFATFFSSLLLLTACVTINVYFPAAAAEKAADQIIDQVWGKDKDPKSQTPPPKTPPIDQTPKTPPTDQKSFNSFSPANRLTQWLDLLITPAHAAADLDISSPTIQALKERMAKRHGKLETFYNNGAIGLTNDALIALRDASKVPLKSRSDISSEVNNENQDRLALYKEIAVANAHPEWESNIRSTFATRWIERAQKGWWYQDSKKQWQQK